MNKMRLGLIARSDNTGLGNQTFGYFKHLKPARTMVIDVGHLNSQEQHPERYPGATFIKGFPTDSDCDKFLEGLDVVLTAEIPYNYYLFEKARRLGIRTVLAFNYEFLDYMQRPHLPKPTVFAAPSVWNISNMNWKVFGDVKVLRVPVDTSELPARHIESARTFFHVAGRPAIHDRNGTLDFISAARLAAPKMPGARFIIYIQQPTVEILAAVRDTEIELISGLGRYGDLYNIGDVLILPRRYGGLCLPAQEAACSGIPVIMPDIDPNNSWLPKSWLVMPSRKRFEFQSRRIKITVHGIDIPALAAKMIELYNDDSKVKHMAAEALAIRRELSWEAMLPKYISLLEGK